MFFLEKKKLRGERGRKERGREEEERERKKRERKEGFFVYKIIDIYPLFIVIYL